MAFKYFCVTDDAHLGILGTDLGGPSFESLGRIVEKGRLGGQITPGHGLIGNTNTSLTFPVLSGLKLEI